MDLGSPSTVTTAGITRKTRVDTAGRVTDTRQPMSTGSDAGTTKTAYYTVFAQARPQRSLWRQAGVGGVDMPHLPGGRAG